MSKRVCLGKIAGPHGVKGLVKIFPYGEDPSLIETLGPAFISAESSETVSIQLKNRNGKFILAAVDGVTERDGATALKGTELFYDYALLPDTDEGEFYYDDLAGLTVVEDSAEIGKVMSVNDFGAGTLLEIRLKSGKEFFLPYQGYVLAVDLDAGTITVQNHKEMIID